MIGRLQRECFFNPHKKLAPGTWYWRYHILDGTTEVMKGPYSFIVKDDCLVFESPSFEAFLANVTSRRLSVVTLGREVAEVRRPGGITRWPGGSLKAAGRPRRSKSTMARSPTRTPPVRDHFTERPAKRFGWSMTLLTHTRSAARRRCARHSANAWMCC